MSDPAYTAGELEVGRRMFAADWQFISDSSEQREPGDGLFLDGNRVHLQPSETGATFSNANSKTVQVRVYGQFRKFDTDQPNKSDLVRVNGEFTATIDAAKEPPLPFPIKVIAKSCHAS